MCQLNWTKYHANQLPQMSCDIELDQSDAAYSVGDVISGQVKFNISKPFYTYAIRVAIEGSAIVKQEDQQKSDTFLDIGTHVYGKGEKIALAAGLKSYKFALKLLPSGGVELPGSYRDPTGFIFYQVVVYLQQELRSYKQAEKGITVQSYYNLSPASTNNSNSSHSGVLSPVVHTKIGKSPSSGMLNFLGLGRAKNTSTQFGVTLRLNRSGYLPGEELPFELEFKNLHQDQQVLAKVSLAQKTLYTGVFSPPKAKYVDLAAVEMKNVSQNVWQGHLELVESVRPTQSGIIEISYTLKVEITLADTPEDPYVIEAPIKIGTEMK